jgi:amidase
MRPTHGRIALQGVLPFAASYDTVGWMANSGELLARAGGVLLGAAQDDCARPLRLRIAQDALALADPEVQDALRTAAVRLGIQQLVCAYAEPWPQWLDAYALLQGLEIQASLGAWIRQRAPRFGAHIAPRFEGALALDPAEGDRWRAWRLRASEQLVAALGADDAWLVPAAPSVALRRDASGARGFFYQRALAAGALAGHAGLPQVVMPLAQAQGLPVGVSLIAGRGNDERLLALASTWDEAGRTR